MQGTIWSRFQQKLACFRTGSTVSRTAGLLGIAAFGLTLATPALATPLEVGQQVVSDGITFTVVSCSFGSTSCSTQATFVSSGGATPGITIAGTASSLVSDPGTTPDLSVEFSASGTGIVGVSLGMVGSSSGLASASVGETVYASDAATSLGTLSVAAGGTTSDTIAFAAESLVYLSKDITTFETSGGSASITSVTQTLSLATVPEPASIFLFLSGLLSLAGFRSTTVRGALRSAHRQRTAIG